MRVHFLGTSAGVPTLRRGLPAVAVEREGELLLFDCGEGTQMALQRSATKASRLAAVFITHLHGDHVLGLPGLLMSLQMAGRTEPLTIIGTPGLKDLVNTVMRLLYARMAYEIHIEEHRGKGTVFTAEEYAVQAERLDHRVPALGYALQEFDRPGRFDLEAAVELGVPMGPLFGMLQRGEAVTLEDGRTVQPEQVVGSLRRGRRIVYMSDTRPCQGAISLAAGGDLLIHEATFEAGWEEEAHTKGHSTVSDAVETALEAKVKTLALTHISPRYETTGELLEQARSRFPASWIAEDGMILTLDRDGELLEVTGGRRRS